MPAEIPGGAVVLARAILKSPIWRMRPEICKVAITCIALANHAPAKWNDGKREFTIEKGQFVRSRKNLAKACVLPIQVVRTAVKLLSRALDEEGVPFLTIKSTSRWTLWSMPKWYFYQDLSNYEEPKRQTSNQRLTSGKGKTNQPNHANLTNTEKPVEALRSPGKATSSTSKPKANPTSKKKRSSKSRKLTTNKNNNNKNSKGPKPSPPTGPIQDSAGPTSPPSKGDSNLLNQVSIRRGVLLLLSIGVKEPDASTLAGQRPIGEVIDVVQEARSKERPGGFAIRALQEGWGVPVHEAARAEILAELEGDRRKAMNNIPALQTLNPKYAQLPGESDRDWLARGMELKRAETKD